jgi:GntR family transcriptional regulator, rspAB operon transcriptional repressor
MRPPPTSRIKSFDRSRHAAPQVFEQLREAIVTLAMAPGTLLSRAELAAQFGLSRTPIRDALMKLGDEGLVDIFPQHATVVSRIDIASAAQAQFLRRAIEAEVVRSLAGRADAALLDQLRAQVDVQAALLGSAAYLEFIAADRAFHRLMYEAAEVPDLYDLVRQRSGHVDRLRMLNLPSVGKQRAIVRDHRRIVDAIAAADAEAAQTALREHLSGTLGQAEVIRLAHPDYFTASP